MMRLMMSTFILAALMFFAALGLAGISELVTGPLRISASVPARPVKEPQGAGNQIVDVKPLEPSNFQQIASRPLFFEGRRVPRPHVEPVSSPAATEPVSEPSPAGSIDRLRLSGVHIALSQRRALVLVGEAGEWRSEGDVVEGWRIVSIEAGQVRLLNGGQSATLTLYAPTSSD